ncbi:MAG: hypothetical protein ACK56F_32315, partial [bacterium]
IVLVEGRCKAEQLHLDIKQQPREVDFVPFRPGTGVSIYEFSTGLRRGVGEECHWTKRRTYCITGTWIHRSQTGTRSLRMSRRTTRQ